MVGFLLAVLPALISPSMKTLTLGDFSMEPKSSWKVTQESGGAVLTQEGEDADSSYVITVGLAPKETNSLDAALQSLKDDAKGAGDVKYTQAVSSSKTASGVPFRVCGGTAANGSESVFLLLFAVGSEKKFLKIAVITQSEKAMQLAHESVFPFVASIKRVEHGAGNKTNDSKPPATASSELLKGFGTGVTGIWKGFSSHIGGKGFDTMVLFANGAMMFKMPNEGLDVYSLSDLQRVYGDSVGSYTFQNGTLTIRSKTGGSWTYRLDSAGRLASTGSSATASYVRSPLFDRGQIEGSYELATVASGAPSYDPLRLTSSGQFAINDLTNLISVDLSLPRDQVKRLRAGGSGTYSIRNGTLHLMFRDGRHLVTSIEVGVDGSSKATSPKTLILNGSVYTLR